MRKLKCKDLIKTTKISRLTFLNHPTYCSGWNLSSVGNLKIKCHCLYCKKFQEFRPFLWIKSMCFIKPDLKQLFFFPCSFWFLPIFYFYGLTWERKGGGIKGEREGEREGKESDRKERGRERGLLFHLFIDKLVDSCMCPFRGSNLQSWHIGTKL